jgi:hypothetical protein
MPLISRVASGGAIFHVLNRANARSRIFGTDQDYEALKQVINESAERIPFRNLAYCHVESLARGCVGGDERPTWKFHATDHHDARSPLAPASRQHGQQPSLPRYLTSHFPSGTMNTF